MLAPVLSVVFITMLINVLKVFDIILSVAPGSSQDDANVIALAMWRTSFGGVNDFGLGSAIAVFLFLLVIPVAGAQRPALQEGGLMPTAVHAHARTRRRPAAHALASARAGSCAVARARCTCCWPRSACCGSCRRSALLITSLLPAGQHLRRRLVEGLSSSRAWPRWTTTGRCSTTARSRTRC